MDPEKPVTYATAISGNPHASADPAATAPAPAAPAASGRPRSAPVPTPQLIASMLQASEKISDLIFSPGRAPQVEISGQLVQLKIPGVGMLSAEDTARIAARPDRPQRARRRKAAASKAPATFPTACQRSRASA